VGDNNAPHGKVGPEVNPRLKLKLPGRAHFKDKIFGRAFDQFLHQISARPSDIHGYEAKTDEADLSIQYNPGQRYGGGSYLDYTVCLLANRQFSIRRSLCKNASVGKDKFQGATRNTPL
jgi:hypothetical protein